MESEIEVFDQLLADSAATRHDLPVLYVEHDRIPYPQPNQSLMLEKPVIFDLENKVYKSRRDII